MAKIEILDDNTYDHNSYPTQKLIHITYYVSINMRQVSVNKIGSQSTCLT